MRTLFAVALLISLVLALPALAQLPEVPGMPSDYQGFAFGADLNGLGGLTFARQGFVSNEMFGDYTVDYYVRGTGAKSFGGVALESEEFGFENGRLTHALLTARGRQAYDQFVAHAAQEYGMQDFSPFSLPNAPDCAKIHHAEDYGGGSEGHAWIWGVQQSDEIFVMVHVQYDPASDTATYRVGWPY